MGRFVMELAQHSADGWVQLTYSKEPPRWAVSWRRERNADPSHATGKDLSQALERALHDLLLPYFYKHTSS